VYNSVHNLVVVFSSVLVFGMAILPLIIIKGPFFIWASKQVWQSMQRVAGVGGRCREA
jgi:hypothetical protein